MRGQRVSLGSFSEAQAMVEPALLQAVFERLADNAPRLPGRPGLRGREQVIDSTVWQVLPRMSWAFWRRQSGRDNAVRLHVEFDLAKGSPRRVALTPAKVCERAAWRQLAQPGRCYIGDRYYGYDYKLLGQLQVHGVDFVVRLRENAHWVEECSERLRPADRAAGVTWAGTARPTADAAPELIGRLYRHRWQVELFSRWLKCILGCRHWLAESPRGVALQVYLALIAAQLLVLQQGARPNRRQMEAIQFYLLGWATPQELLAKVQPAPKQKR